ncbi:MAG: triose-phosphate isomerase, partial [Candidatus Micrarchaeota archaeon]|nr:triose-phosphate isomerase [Candidatus Micrarchaeota archaeon]
MRRYLIAGNWKMNKTVSESVELARGLVERLKDVDD